MEESERRLTIVRIKSWRAIADSDGVEAGPVVPHPSVIVHFPYHIKFQTARVWTTYPQIAGKVALDAVF
jgi:hypothetical protein